MITEVNTDTKMQIVHKRMLADKVTPVGLYLKIRKQFPHSVLLESNDFKAAENCYSILGIEPIAGFLVENGELRYFTPEVDLKMEDVDRYNDIPERLNAFIKQFQYSNQEDLPIAPGFFGHSSFDSIQYFEKIKFDPKKRKLEMPDINYNLYRFVILINHFTDEMHLIEQFAANENSKLESLENLLKSTFEETVEPFKIGDEEGSNMTDEAFRDLVRVGKQHCQMGDVFQIVFSRQFFKSFTGDEFQVYRVLRSINPSPYLFYFDYGDYKIFGSSPEAQLVIKNGEAQVNPIAGTYKRTGNDAEDQAKAKELALDPKENAEHIMLVDLARNDLGKHATDVTVKKLKEIQYFSHVIHLVSNVVGQLESEYNPIEVFGDSFPAGTLSGAPKYKALQLIDQYENQNRGFYGGGIGFIGVDGSMNQAIVIRSFLSKNNTLYSQAGAGIVVDSDPEKELQEVNHKLGALTKAIKLAEKLTN
jgi:anthranilate synthase component 1